MCKLLLELDGASLLRIFGLQPIKLQWVINICLINVIARYTWLALFADIIFSYTTNTQFYYVSILFITKLYLSHKFRINCFVIFCNTMFCCRQVHLRPPESFNHRHKANIEIHGSIRGQLIVFRKIMTLI